MVYFFEADKLRFCLLTCCCCLRHCIPPSYCSTLDTVSSVRIYKADHEQWKCNKNWFICVRGVVEGCVDRKYWSPFFNCGIPPPKLKVKLPCAQGFGLLHKSPLREEPQFGLKGRPHGHMVPVLCLEDAVLTRGAKWLKCLAFASCCYNMTTWHSPLNRRHHVVHAGHPAASARAGEPWVGWVGIGDLWLLPGRTRV